ncbi:EH signature domain-containing protein [Pueribacillus theae]|nr:EH signature domain-containing protein [Pueribacillus theae]
MEVEKKYKDVESKILAGRIKNRLPKLLEQIRALPNGPEAIKEFANRISKLDIRMLAYEYPFHQEEEQTIEKIISILMAGYIREVGRVAWKLFQNEVNDKGLLKLLSFIFKSEDETFLGLDQDSRRQINQAVYSGDIIKELPQFLLKANEKASILLKRWKVKNDSYLERELIKRMLLKGLSETFIIQRESPDQMVVYLSQYTLQEYQEMIKNYLEARTYEQFDNEILIQALDNLGDPRTNQRSWKFISESSLKEVNHWLTQNKLKHFFEQDRNNERFLYWKKYTKSIEDLHFIEEPQIVFMDFGDFVVVEFGKMGAAYFYHKEGFRDIILPRKNSAEFRRRGSQAREAMFKEKDMYEMYGRKLYIHKLDHRGYWHSKFDSHMRHYFRGLYFYQD